MFHQLLQKLCLYQSKTRSTRPCSLLTLGHDRVSLADSLYGLKLEFPLLEDVERPVRPARSRVSVEQPAKKKKQDRPKRTTSRLNGAQPVSQHMQNAARASSPGGVGKNYKRNACIRLHRILTKKTMLNSDTAVALTSSSMLAVCNIPCWYLGYVTFKVKAATGTSPKQERHRTQERVKGSNPYCHSGQQMARPSYSFFAYGCARCRHGHHDAGMGIQTRNTSTSLPSSPEQVRHDSDVAVLLIRSHVPVGFQPFDRQVKHLHQHLNNQERK